MGGVVLDLGCAEGTFALSVIDKARKVICFEPDASWCNTLRYTFKSHSKEVEVVNRFVSSVTNLEDNQISIDDYFGENIPDDISVVKMDIEGAEQEALHGMRKTLEKNPQAVLLICAYHTKEASKEIREILNDMKYLYDVRDGKVVYCIESNDKEDILRDGLIEAYKGA